MWHWEGNLIHTAWCQLRWWWWGGADSNKLPPQHHCNISHPTAHQISPWLPELIFFLRSPWSLLWLSREIINQVLNINVKQNPFFVFVFCTKRQKPIRNPHTLTRLCKFGCLKCKKLWLERICFVLFESFGELHLPPDKPASWLPGNALGCCLHRVWWGPMGKDVFGALRNLLSPLDSCSLFNCDGNRTTKKKEERTVWLWIDKTAQSWHLQQKWKQNHSAAQTAAVSLF